MVYRVQNSKECPADFKKQLQNFTHGVVGVAIKFVALLGKRSTEKKRFLSGIARMMGGWGGLPMPEFFGPLFRSAFLVNKKSLFLQKYQCIELLTVF